MLWGVTLQPGEPFTELVVDEIRLSMASLEFRSSKTTVPCPISHVVVTTIKGEYLLCSLEKGSTPQQSLDLVLQPKEEVTFSIEGTGVVHLTGYTPEGPQEYIQVTPPDNEGIFYIEGQGSDEPDHGLVSQGKYMEEQGSDELDHGPTSQVRCSVKSEEESTTTEIIYPEDDSQTQNSSQCSSDSYPEATVKTEVVDNTSTGEGLYQGWIPEENHPVIQSIGSIVGVSQCANSESRVYDNMHACIYCSKLISCKMKRHLVKMHSEEAEVRIGLAIPDIKVRQTAFDQLRLRGNHQHNVRVLQTGQGHLLILRRPKHAAVVHRPEEYIPCPDCLGYVVQKDLKKHQQLCTPSSFRRKEGNSGTKHLTENRNILPLSYVDPPQTAITSMQAYVFFTMANDAITLVAKNDPLIFAYGLSILESLGNARATHVSYKMRELSRLLLSLREADPLILNLEDVIDPIKFETLVMCVKNVCARTDRDAELGGVFQMPSLAQRLGYSLEACASLLQARAINLTDNVTIDRVSRYLRRYNCPQSGYSVQISARVLETIHISEQREEPEILPLATTDDGLGDYMEIEIDGVGGDEEEEEDDDDGEDAEEGDRETEERPGSDPSYTAGSSRGTIDHKRMRMYKRKSWTTKEKRALWECFGHYIKSNTLPGKRFIEHSMDMNSILQGRTWRNIKDAVRNIISKEEKEEGR